jgi:hypothetical protein
VRDLWRRPTPRGVRNCSVFHDHSTHYAQRLVCLGTTRYSHYQTSYTSSNHQAACSSSLACGIGLGCCTQHSLPQHSSIRYLLCPAALCLTPFPWTWRGRTNHWLPVISVIEDCIRFILTQQLGTVYQVLTLCSYFYQATHPEHYIQTVVHVVSLRKKERIGTRIHRRAGKAEEGARSFVIQGLLCCWCYLKAGPIRSRKALLPHWESAME